MSKMIMEFITFASMNKGLNNPVKKSKARHRCTSWVHKINQAKTQQVEYHSLVHKLHGDCSQFQ